MHLGEACGFARALAREAGELLLGRFRRVVSVRTKSPGQIVSEADEAAEDLLRSRIAERFPSHAVVGEERGASGPAGEMAWCLDPLDGTSNFVAGVPYWAVSVALLEGGRPVVGVVHDPLLRETWHAVAGEGSYRGEVRVWAREGELDPEALIATPSRFREGTPRWVGRVYEGWKVRNTGAFTLNAVLVADGGFAGCISDDVRLWDLAAASLILEEAGARVSAMDGSPLFPVEPTARAWERGYTFLGAGAACHGPLLGLVGRRTPTP
ncbi:MAG: inositol monophosphatase [Planctomycetes bacterium]|nr:inositol monophosphatase [Planctomycetota bacterium]